LENALTSGRGGGSESGVARGHRRCARPSESHPVYFMQPLRSRRSFLHRRAKLRRDEARKGESLRLMPPRDGPDLTACEAERWRHGTWREPELGLGDGRPSTRVWHNKLLNEVGRLGAMIKTLVVAAALTGQAGGPGAARSRSTRLIGGSEQGSINQRPSGVDGSGHCGSRPCRAVSSNRVESQPFDGRLVPNVAV
jgi:hypothetical protein